MEIWEQFLQAIGKRISGNTYFTWFGPLEFVSQEGNKLIIKVPQPAYQYVLKEFHGQSIKAALYEIGHPELTLELIVGGE